MIAADEEREVLVNRASEAIKAGLTVLEAKAFAASGVDIGLLRKLVAQGCPKDQLRRIVL
jgi:hypothetical protein